MNNLIVRKLALFCQQFGFQPAVALQSVLGLPRYCLDFLTLWRQQRSSTVRFAFGSPYPCLSDRHAESGVASGQYFHHDLLVAQRIFANSPSKHVDVGSRIDGFVAHVAASREIEVFDVRPMRYTVANVTFRQVDMMDALTPSLHKYCDSVSSLSAVEHFGLGRYGDRLDFEGYLMGIQNLKDLLVSGGKMYFSVPIGQQRIEFNAHRVFSVSYLLSLMDDFKVDSFSFVDDRGALHRDVPLTHHDVETNFGCWFGCGILEMTKK